MRDLGTGDPLVNGLRGQALESCGVELIATLTLLQQISIPVQGCGEIKAGSNMARA